MSYTSTMRPWPMWGGAYTVGPHTYIDTLPGSRWASGTTCWVAVSYRLIMASRVPSSRPGPARNSGREAPVRP